MSSDELTTAIATLKAYATHCHDEIGQAAGKVCNAYEGQVKRIDGLRQSNAGLQRTLAEMGNALLDAEREIAELRAALHKIADRPDAEMEAARTLHYDMRGWARAALGGR